MNIHRTTSVSEKTLHSTEPRSKIASALPRRIWFTQPTETQLVCVIRLMQEGGSGAEEALLIQEILQPFAVYFRSVISVGVVGCLTQQELSRITNLVKTMDRPGLVRYCL